MRVEVRRGGVVESTHLVHAVAVAPDGRILGSSGEASRFTFMRSSFKPIQAVAALMVHEEAREAAHARAGAPDANLLPGGSALEVDDREIAIACGSHAASAEHVAVVAALLDRIGCSPDDLTCGVESPKDDAERARLAREGLPATTLHSNCSGKHAFMLATCRAAGWPVEGYASPDHPLQRRIRQVAARFFGLAPDDLTFAVDGCGLPAPAVELWRMALAYARLASAAAGDDSVWKATPAERRAAARVVCAMRAHPHLTRDGTHFAVQLMRRTDQFSKPGADGVMCTGSPGGRWGLALKSEDGGARALPPATCAVLGRFGLMDAAGLAALAEFSAPPLRNVAGAEVGEVAVAGATA